MPTVARTQALPLPLARSGSEKAEEKGVEKTSSFSMNGALAHIAEKADYKALGNGQYVKAGNYRKFSKWVTGNVADDRYHRQCYEGSQYVSAAVCAEEFRLNLENPGAHNQLDIQKSDLVRNRFARQDNIRYRSKLTGEQYGLNKMGKFAVWTSRIAHWCNGITEVGAAPTGMLLKISRCLVNPKLNEKSGKGHLLVLGALVLVTAAVAAVSFGLFRMVVAEKGLMPFLGDMARNLALSLVGVVASFSAVALLGALGSLAFSGISAMAATGLKISPQIAAQIERDKNTHVDRLFELMQEIQKKPDLKALVADAMRGEGFGEKIPQGYLNNAGQPKLLEMLVQATATAGSKEAGLAAIQKTLGRYMVLRDLEGGETQANALKPDADVVELLQREKHVIALTNLIEHTRIGTDERGAFKDIRHRCDKAAAHIKKGILEKRLAKLFDKVGMKSWAETMRNCNDEDWLNQRNVDKKDPSKAQDMRFCADNILENPHQYGKWTVRLMRAAEAIRLFNSAVVLSFNYQLTRPFAWACSKFCEHVLHMPPCRCVAFSVGRAVSSGAWAALDSFLFISLAGGSGVGNAHPHGTLLEKNLPLQVPMAHGDLPISVISTGAHMLLLGCTAAPIMLLAMGAARVEGWKGNEGRATEPLNSRRAPRYI